MTARNSGIWLAAQGVLALIRMAIWIKDPTCDNYAFDKGHGPTYDTWSWDTNSNSASFSDMQLGLMWSAQLERIDKARSNAWQHIFSLSDDRLDKDFSMPTWAANGLQNSFSCLPDLFVVAASIYNTDMMCDNSKILSILTRDLPFWDMPGWLFMSWVWSHARPDEPLPSRSYKLSSFSCRVILDENKKCHVFPFWITGGYYSKRFYTTKIFGKLITDGLTLIHISRKKIEDDYETRTLKSEEVSDLDLTPFTGWRSPVPVDEHFKVVMPANKDGSLDFIDFLNCLWAGTNKKPVEKEWIRNNAIYTMDLMWKDLVTIIEHATHHSWYTLPWAFQRIRDMEISPPAGGRG